MRAYSLGKIGGWSSATSTSAREAVAVGASTRSRPDGYIVTTYRDHGQALARGMSARAVMAEQLGEGTGCSHGKGGSMHLFDASLGFLGGHGIVGGHIRWRPASASPSSTGSRTRWRSGFFSEAAINNGAFHEALNMAGIYKAPCIFICENNRYGMGTALDRATATWNISERAASYDMSREVVDGRDLLEVQAAMDRAVVRARRPAAPTLLEIRTYRFVGHSMSDPIHGHYRTKEEVEAHRLRDPITLWSEKLKADGLIDDEALRKMDEG
ncbi:MAG: thiamine pyrophosphate-dependent enzyme [Gemmatimonadales bacterium]